MHVPRRRGIGHAATLGLDERGVVSAAARPGVRKRRRYSAGATPTRGRRSGGAAAPRSRSRPGRRPSRSARSVLSSRVAGVVQPLGEQPLAGRRAGLGGEAAGEGALGHRGARRRARAPAGPRRGARASRSSSGERLSAVAVGHRQVDVLALAAVALGGHHHPAGDLVGHGGAELAAHVVQAGVDAGRGAGTGDHPVVLDEEHVGIDRRPPGTRARARRCAASGWCRRGRRAGPASPSRNAPGADREHPGAPGVGAAEDVEDCLGRGLQSSP